MLVVDDYEDNRMLYVAYFKACGFRVDDAADGLEAVEKARQGLPDVILMDLALPGIDGWEATRRLKSDPATKHIVIFALSGHTLEAHAALAARSGATCFSPSPTRPRSCCRRSTRSCARSDASNSATAVAF